MLDEFRKLPTIQHYIDTFNIEYDSVNDTFYSFLLGSYPLSQYVNGAYIVYKHFQKISPHS